MTPLRLPIQDGKQSSHLAVRLDRPEKPRDPGLTVLYCHGFASSQSGEKADYLRLRFLEEGIAFCSFDFRGHGDSGGEIFELSMSRNLADMALVHEYLRQEGFERLLLFGSSMGGAVASWYATRVPEAILAAIYIAPGLEMEQGLLRLLGPEKSAEWRQEGEILFEHELGGYMLSWHLIEDLRDYPRARLARSYQTPTLIFQGMRDETVTWRTVVDLAETTQASVAVHLFSDGDHRLIGRLPHLWRLCATFLAERGVLED